MEKETLEEITGRLAVENFVIEFSTREGDYEIYAGRVHSAVPEFYDGEEGFSATVYYPDARLIKRGDFDQPIVMELQMSSDKMYLLKVGGEPQYSVRGPLKDLNPKYGLERSIVLEGAGVEYTATLKLFKK